MTTHLFCRSHYSAQRALGSPEAVVGRCKELGYSSCALADTGSLAGAASFLKAAKDGGIKGIIGCELAACVQKDIEDKKEAPLSSLVALATCQEGWGSLVAALSASHGDGWLGGKARISAESLGPILAGCAVITGHMGTEWARAVFPEPVLAWEARTVAEAEALVSASWRDDLRVVIKRYKALFPRLYCGIQLVQAPSLPACGVLADFMRRACSAMGVAPIAVSPSHYIGEEDAPDHRVLVCCGEKTTLADSAKLRGEASAFFRGAPWHVPSPAERAGSHAELAHADSLAESCSAVSVSRPPLLPEVPDADARLKASCREGWKKKIRPLLEKEPAKRTLYEAAVKEELSVLGGAGLFPYFLVVQDYTEFAIRELKAKVNRGRGSAAGCLVSYLMGITGVEPLGAGLLFFRFYNDSRNVPAHVDFPGMPFADFKPAPGSEGAWDWATQCDSPGLFGRPGRARHEFKQWLAAEEALLASGRVRAYYRAVADASPKEPSSPNPRNSVLLWALGLAVKPTAPPVITPGRNALPDIDSDFPADLRDEVVAYCRKKYGEDKVAQMATFSRMQGKGALKDVLRVHGSCGFEEMNRVTEHIPDPSLISGDLELMEEPSIIRWALTERAERLRPWCWLGESGATEGPLAMEFAQAIRLEGTRRDMSRHASGVIISPSPLAGLVPMVRDSSGRHLIVGVDMRDAEEMGLVKFDILGNASLSAVGLCERIARGDGGDD